MARDFEVGGLFVFLFSKEYRKKVRVYRNGDEYEPESFPAVLPRVLFEVKGEEEAQRLRVPRQPVIAVVTDKKMYREGEVVRVLFAGFGAEELEYRVFHHDEEILRENVKLDEYGFAYVELEDLLKGDYRVEVSAGEWKSKAEFTVAEYSFSPLVAVLEEFRVKGEILEAKVRVSLLGAPYEGKLEVGLFCGYCDDVVKRKELSVEEGLARVEFSLKGHTGPFSLYFYSPEGYTASVYLESTRVEERREETLSDMGRIHEASLVPRPGSEEVRDVYVWESGATTTPVLLEKPYGESVTLRVLEKLKALTVVVLNPSTGNFKVMSYRDLKGGSTLRFPVEKPYVILMVGCITEENKAYESAAIALSPTGIGLRIDAPSKAMPGGMVKVSIKTEKRARVLLLVRDARLESENLSKKLSRELFVSSTQLRKNLMRTFPEVFERRVLLVARPARHVIASTMLPAAVLRDLLVSMESGAIIAAETPIGGEIKEEVRGAVFFEVLEVDGLQEVEVKLGEQIGNWVISAVAIADGDWETAESIVEAVKEVGVEIDAPVFLGEGDLAAVKVAYSLRGRGILRVRYPGGSMKDEVEGRGFIEVLVSEPGNILAEITSGSLRDSIRHRVERPGLERVRVSELEVLVPGDEVYLRAGEKLYPPALLLSEVVNSLVKYPFGCAEQTSAKLGGLALVSVAIRSGVIEGNIERVERLISIGLNRMKNFFKEDMFSLWEDGEPEVTVTVKVLSNLRPLVEHGYSTAVEMARKASNKLLEMGVRDNRLLYLSEKFYEGLRGVEDAVYAYLAGVDKRKAVDAIYSTVKEEGGTAWWPPNREKSWAGPVETTCEALKIVLLEGDYNLLKRGLRYVSKRLINGRLYTTSDTRAFVEFLNLAYQQFGNPRVRLNGREETLRKAIEGPTRVKALSPVFLKRDREVVVNHLQPVSRLTYRVQISSTKMTLGSKCRVSIEVADDCIAPIAMVWLPPCLVLMRGGVNVQHMHKAVKRGVLEFEAVAARKGWGYLRTAVYDMYDSSKIGVTPPIRVVVE